MKRLYTFALLSLLASSSIAAVSPYWDSVKQIQSILNHADLEVVIKGPVVGIQNRGYLTYVVSSALCRTIVRLKATPPKVPGPTEYSVLSMDQTICKDVTDPSQISTLQSVEDDK